MSCWKSTENPTSFSKDLTQQTHTNQMSKNSQKNVYKCSHMNLDKEQHVEGKISNREENKKSNTKKLKKESNNVTTNSSQSK